MADSSGCDNAKGVQLQGASPLALPQTPVPPLGSRNITMCTPKLWSCMDLPVFVIHAETVQSYRNILCWMTD